MINCDDILEFSGDDYVVEWDPYGTITGFANGSDTVSIELDGGTEVKFNASADGLSGTLSVNNKSNGQATLKLNPGSGHVGALRQSFLRNKARRGALSITSPTSGESWDFGCAGLMKSIPFSTGSEAPDSFDIQFWFSSVDYTPPRGSRGLDGGL